MADDFDFDDAAFDAAAIAAAEAAERSVSSTPQQQQQQQRGSGTAVVSQPTPRRVVQPVSRPVSAVGAAIGVNVNVLRPGTAGSGHGVGSPVQQPTPQKLAKPAGFNAIIVNARQKGNPILNHVRNVPWEYGDIVPDFVVGQTSCAIYLSLRYHRLHPEYIYSRISQLGKQYNLRLLLISVDIENHEDSLKALTKTAIISDLTMILAWSPAEAGRYLETFKSFESKPPTLIQGKQSTTYMEGVVEMMTSIRSVNKTDAMSLLANFGSVKRAINAEGEEVGLIGGWGDQKVRRFLGACGEPFVVGGTRRKRVRATQADGVEEGGRDMTASERRAENGGVQGAVFPPMTAPPPMDVEDEDALEAMLALKEIGDSAAKEKDKETEEVPEGEGEDAGVMAALAKLRAQAGGYRGFGDA
ncbi:ssDNA endonuclease and repair protein rad10 [Saitoella coloradoensis]